MSLSDNRNTFREARSNETRKTDEAMAALRHYDGEIAAAAYLASRALATHEDWANDALNVRDEFDRLIDKYLGEA